MQSQRGRPKDDHAYAANEIARLFHELIEPPDPIKPLDDHTESAQGPTRIDASPSLRGMGISP